MKLTVTGAAAPSGKSETVTHASYFSNPKHEPWVADFRVAIGYLRSGWSRVRGASFELPAIAYASESIGDNELLELTLHRA